MKTKHTPLWKFIRKNFTRSKRVLDVCGMKNYRAYLVVGNQDFSVTGISYNSKTQVEWFRSRLADALEKMVIACRQPDAVLKQMPLSKSEIKDVRAMTEAINQWTP